MVEELNNYLPQIFSAWFNQDKENFKILVANAIHKGLGKKNIIDYLESNRNNQEGINEEFEEWAYSTVAYEGLFRNRFG